MTDRTSPSALVTAASRGAQTIGEILEQRRREEGDIAFEIRKLAELAARKSAKSWPEKKLRRHENKMHELRVKYNAMRSRREEVESLIRQRNTQAQTIDLVDAAIDLRAAADAEKVSEVGASASDQELGNGSNERRDGGEDGRD